MTTMNKISRKDFMKNTGKTVVGVAAIGALSGALTVSAEEKTREAAPFPYKYKKIDPDQARDRAYEAYFEQGG